LKVEKMEIVDELQLKEIPDVVEVKIPDTLANADFADRMEYLWNLNED